MAINLLVYRLPGLDCGYGESFFVGQDPKDKTSQEMNYSDNPTVRVSLAAVLRRLRTGLANVISE
ncbi:MAG TPA: hypothetical protein VLY63_22775 [Anaerolineae bacterium]|nr:hypothetical protein [Anaerolineae bacterium]